LAIQKCNLSGIAFLLKWWQWANPSL
jgi:hypothetical protein